VKRCKDCAIGKGRQKHVTKSSKHVISTKVGEGCIFLDIATVLENKDSDALIDSNRKKRYWRILVDEASQFKISDFFISKNGKIEPTCEKLFRINSDSKSIKYIRCDKRGDNQGLKNQLHSFKWKGGRRAPTWPGKRRAGKLLALALGKVRAREARELVLPDNSKINCLMLIINKEL
jgi:hypothetical protein